MLDFDGKKISGKMVTPIPKIAIKKSEQTNSTMIKFDLCI